MRVNVLASGSTGNCSYIETKTNKILIDAGISKKSIESGLLNVGVNFEEIDTLLITHEHDDHIRSLAAVLRKSEITCYLTKGTYEAILNGKNEALKKVMLDRFQQGHIILLNRLEKSIFYPDVFINDVVINVLPTFHDALEPVGYKITDGESSVVYITDTGYIHHNLYEIISNSDCYILEFNHDPQVLMASDRSLSLKRRILSDHGHLSNEDAFFTLYKIMGEKTKYVFYAHISQECNLIEIIELTRQKVIDSLGVNDNNIKYIVTSPVSTEVYNI